jgi:hypothetical protein
MKQARNVNPKNPSGIYEYTKELAERDAALNEFYRKQPHSVNNCRDLFGAIILQALRDCFSSRGTGAKYKENIREDDISKARYFFTTKRWHEFAEYAGISDGVVDKIDDFIEDNRLSKWKKDIDFNLNIILRKQS